jgi:hypothetical protein
VSIWRYPLTSFTVWIKLCNLIFKLQKGFADWVVEFNQDCHTINWRQPCNSGFYSSQNKGTKLVRFGWTIWLIYTLRCLYSISVNSFCVRLCNRTYRVKYSRVSWFAIFDYKKWYLSLSTWTTWVSNPDRYPCFRILASIIIKRRFHSRHSF